MKMTKQQLTGIDKSIEISLYEYNLAWYIRENVFHFIVKISDNPMLFDWADIPIDVDLKEEFGFVEWDDIFSFTGLCEKDWFSMDLPYKISDLIQYYGNGNIIGTCYYPMTLDTILEKYDIDKPDD